MSVKGVAATAVPFINRDCGGERHTTPDSLYLCHTFNIYLTAIVVIKAQETIVFIILVVGFIIFMFSFHSLYILKMKSESLF